ncbi:MAG: inositol monophosphatase family protein, partial [Myxococcota bacterium]
AGERILEGFRTEPEVSTKGSSIDLLTKYDLAAEEILRARLVDAFPEHGIVGEEGDKVVRELTWYIDPIDGTTNYAHGHPFFCVSMGLYRQDHGLVAVIFAPALDVRWTAIRGSGAERNGELCRVSSTEGLGKALGATGFPYDRASKADNNLREFGRFVTRCRGIRRCGSAALDLALVADGTYDFYWEKDLNAWDMCGGALLVEEAGGRLSDYRGRAADPRKGQLVASNGYVHDAVLELLGG